MKQCWEFSSNRLPGDYTLSKGISLPFSCLPSELQKTLKLNQRFENVRFEDKVLQRVSSVSINAVKYAHEDVFVAGHVHTEAIPLFFKTKYILNVDTLWVLCGKLLVPKSYESNFHVTVDKDWTLLNPGNLLDHQALDTYLFDDRLFVSLRYSV